jgi:hypothetical protein
LQARWALRTVVATNTRPTAMLATRSAGSLDESTSKVGPRVLFGAAFGVLFFVLKGKIKLISESKLRMEYDGTQAQLITLPDGYELDPPWAYSDNPQMSLGQGRFQLEVDESMSDEEIGRRIRYRFAIGERKTLLDVQAFTPTS